ncbi:MAG TPA: hypothetical protein VEJ38_13620 [Candidatus Acidoferrales bacterium]|nr:hypothetical protein [Candidatus Acidoferrales bacterium]
MKSYKIAAGLTALCGGLAISGTPAPAQTVSAPVIVRQQNPAPESSTKGEWYTGQVVHADAYNIVVFEPGNERVIHSFTVSADLKDKMQSIVDHGGYQYGDRVKILHAPGQTVALKIKGKPSNPS